MPPNAANAANSKEPRGATGPRPRSTTSHCKGPTTATMGRTMQSCAPKACDLHSSAPFVAVLDYGNRLARIPAVSSPTRPGPPRSSSRAGSAVRLIVVSLKISMSERLQRKIEHDVAWVARLVDSECRLVIRAGFARVHECEFNRKPIHVVVPAGADADERVEGMSFTSSYSASTTLPSSCFLSPAA